MKTTVNLLSFFFILLLLCACEESPFQPNDRFPVQGKWKIEQLTFLTLDKKDSVVSKELGSLEFGSCRKNDNRIGACERGKRIYADGQTTDFYFQTAW
ncbi:MAG TPA: hypothetical protein VEX63_10910, partial [Flavisolibacter sp.]|nr:hypothetical protein [Flavisolibacter sp.]